MALEPAYALAWAELGRAYATEADWGSSSPAEGYGRAREAVARALALEPDLAEGHAGMGYLQMMHDWDWRGAEASYRRALELAPGNALVLHRAGQLAETFGRFEEAISLYRRAAGQNPLGDENYFRLGVTLFAADRLAEAATALKYGAGTRDAEFYGALLARRGPALSRPRRGGVGGGAAGVEKEYRLLALAIIHHAAARQVEQTRQFRNSPRIR